MKLYFVRHGETIDNAKRQYQTNDSSLSDLGKQQVNVLTKRLQTIPIDYIFCSPLLRCEETGLMINKALKKPIEFTNLLTEIKLPKEIEGQPKDDPKIKRISRTLKDNFHNSSWKYSNEETFLDIKKRAINFIEMVKFSQKQDVLIISHNIFISAIIAVLMFGKEATSRELFNWMYFAIMENTGISLCQYTQDRGWRLMVWNDYSHLRILQ